jgi:hypothetical protein
MVIGPAASSPKVNQSKITLNLEPLNPGISHLFSYGNMLFWVNFVAAFPSPFSR